MKQGNEIYLRHVLESIQAVGGYLQGVSEDKFMASSQLQDSVVRRIEIIGEAVKNVSDKFKNEHPDIPWKKIAGMRDNLAHEYFSVDEKLVWVTATRDLPVLAQQIKKAMPPVQTES